MCHHRHCEVACWGVGSHGVLGRGSTQNIGSHFSEDLVAVPLPQGPVEDVAAGWSNSCAIVSGSVYCWGGWAEGTLGQGIQEDLGDTPGELPSNAMPLGGASKKVSVGGRNACAIQQDGTVKCWGVGVFGINGQGSREDIGSSVDDMPRPRSTASMQHKTSPWGTITRASFSVERCIAGVTTAKGNWGSDRRKKRAQCLATCPHHPPPCGRSRSSEGVTCCEAALYVRTLSAAPLTQSSYVERAP